MLMFQLRLEFAFDCAAAPGDTKACRNGIASKSTVMEPGVATENLKVVEVPTFEDPLASFGDVTVPASARVMAFPVVAVSNSAGFASCVFQSSHRRGPYGHDSPMALERRVDRRRSLLRNRKMFFMKLMTFDHILPNWLKGSQTYMQGNFSRFNASFSQTT